MLRYYESRELVLLELLHSEASAWLAELDHATPRQIQAGLANEL